MEPIRARFRLFPLCLAIRLPLRCFVVFRI
ncbi:unnamed protein product [Tetraodon nigroviridis]|uniref:(spotted green pufferfish) hypothetical protein n=1 Tax=Tetraodon nigroviridis TaxID=99883 RepID=Q4SWE3_TETNG|nr:unnamed protein product [Tetraodon nigroviridis]